MTTGTLARWRGPLAMASFVLLTLACGHDDSPVEMRGDGGPTDGSSDGADGATPGTDARPGPDAREEDDASASDAAITDGATDGHIEDAGYMGPSTMMTGQVFSARTLTAIENATVSSWIEEVTTNATGEFTITVPADMPTVIQVQEDDHAATSVPFEVSSMGNAYLEVRMIPVAASSMVDVGTGGMLVSGAAKVSVPANAFMLPSGTMATGDVELSLAILDPNQQEDLLAVPGELIGTEMSGDEAALESVGMLDITAMQGGEKLALAPGVMLDVDFPTFGETAETVPVWSLDPETGTWMEEGTATRVDNGSGTMVYRTQLAHMSWWNLDYARAITCIRGCVTHGGNPANNVAYRVTGLTANRQAVGFTDGDGCFAEDVGIGESFRMRFIRYDATAEISFVSPTTPMRAAAGREACMDLGTIALEDVTPTPGVPAGSVLCEGTVTDVVSDDDNCGGCDISCSGGDVEGGGGLLGASCVDGVCECAPSLDACSGRCVDTQTDRNNCGTCGMVCPTGETCEAGSCEPIDCGALALCGNDCVDLESSNQHCGSCDSPCGGEGDAEGAGGPFGSTCQSGMCECPMGHDACGGSSCIDLSDDNSNCGACETMCTASQACQGGTCTDIMCMASETICHRTCVDTDTDVNHCGGCDQPCGGADEGGILGPVCTGGMCDCPTGYDNCSLSAGYFECVDLQTDRNNCGACRTFCATGTECMGGSCEPIVCMAGETLCGNDCVDTATDPNHCGGCNEYCSLTCAAGGCGCPAGEMACPPQGEGQFSCVADASMCPEGDASGPCGDVSGTWSVTDCLDGNATIEQIDCAASIMPCYSGGVVSGDTLTFECFGYDCTATVSGDTMTLECSSGGMTVCTATGSRVIP